MPDQLRAPLRLLFDARFGACTPYLPAHLRTALHALHTHTHSLVHYYTLHLRAHCCLYFLSPWTRTGACRVSLLRAFTIAPCSLPTSRRCCTQDSSWLRRFNSILRHAARMRATVLLACAFYSGSFSRALFSRIASASSRASYNAVVLPALPLTRRARAHCAPPLRAHFGCAPDDVIIARLARGLV